MKNARLFWRISYCWPSCRKIVSSKVDIDPGVSIEGIMVATKLINAGVWAFSRPTNGQSGRSPV